MTNAVNLAQAGNSNSSLGFKNRIINGAMNIWQRGTTGTASTYGYLAADRWATNPFGTSTTLAQSTSVPTDGFRYSLKLQRPASNADVTPRIAMQTIESVNCADLSGQQVTLSFWAKAGANFSGTYLATQLYTGTTADQGGTTYYSWAGATAAINAASSLTTTWTQYTFTGIFGSGVLEAAILIYYTPVGTAGADDAIYITGVQLEKGSTATQFDYRDYGRELIMCQRYYAKLGGTGASGYMAIGSGIGRSGTLYSGYIKFPTTMRAAPTLAISGAMAMMYSGDNWVNISTIASTYGGYDSTLFQGAVASSVLSAGMALVITQNADSAAFIAMASEL
jgi:hypothetical protein